MENNSWFQEVEVEEFEVIDFDEYSRVMEEINKE